MHLTEALKNGSPYTIAKSLLDEWDGWLEWEPETIEDELRLLGQSNEDLLDKVLAIQTLLVNDDFFTEAIVLEKVVLALCGTHVISTTVQDPTPAELNYGVTTAKSVRKLAKRSLTEFDDDVLKYIAGVLWYNGFVLCPAALADAQPYLDRVNPQEDLKTKVRNKWSSLKPESLKSLELSEDSAVDVQISRLLEVALYRGAKAT